MVDKITSMRGSNRFFWWAGFFCVAAFLVDLAVTLFDSSRDQFLVFSDISSAILGLAAAAALFFAARRTMPQSFRLGRAWTLIAVAQLCYAIGDVTWAVLELGFHEAPFPSIADFYYLSHYPIFFIGIRLLIDAKASRYEALKTFLDISIIMLASLLVFGNYLLGPVIISVAKNTLQEQALSLAYPVGGLVMLWALTILLFYPPRGQHPAPLWFLVASMTMLIVTNSVFCYQTLNDNYQTGLTDLGWITTHLLSLAAGVCQGELAGRPDQGNPHRSERFLSGLRQFFIQYARFIWAIAAFWILVRAHQAHSILDFNLLAAGVGVVIGLAVIRQVIALLENQKLAADLSRALEQVQRQASDLESTNLALQSEIAERKRAEQQLSHDALHDALTGLPNRTLFLDRLGWAMEYTRRRADCPFSILFMDLDSFKVVNDSLGHSTGDDLLKAIAGRLKRNLRASDTVARLGGDEFVILLEDSCEARSAPLVARRILADLANPFEILGRTVVATASIGIVQDISDYAQPEDALRDADIAMYHAKTMGRSRYEIFDRHLREQAISRLELENDMRRELASGTGFLLYYQPILKLDTAQIAGFEALVRWKHPQRGLILPGSFIPLAEETGLIIPLGHWVLREACRQLLEWQQEYPCDPPLTVSVNISSKQFNQPDFAGKIQQVLRETGLDGNSLKLELTESVCLESSGPAQETFNQLKVMGVATQIDDFGTGYSALGYLNHFPNLVQTLKIDRTFVQEIERDGTSPGLVRTIVALAHDMGMEAIAEGIESEEQLAGLRDLGCPYGQGFLFSRPLERNAASLLLRERFPV
ncbi:MAG TPA: EAL domain-containing protein [Anaerolineaceae bacterium]|nr:EAL domain-containing protein [Anaerolineaceae bacterium]